VEGLVVLDFRERAVVLFDREWALRTAERFHPELRFAETATGVVVRAA
jgi:peptide chain release factor 3